MKEKGHVAIYLRLSLEDKQSGETDIHGESNSITSQRKMLLDFIQKDEELSGRKILEFCDDGVSGTSMNRPGMQELLKKVKEGEISCILVKDMSRFARDYIELGTYLNEIFPFMKVRFISVNDHYDSREHGGSTIAIDTAFRTLLYDLYSKDLSVKVKAAFQTKRANGEYITGEIPLGYERSREKKNAVVINEKEADIVRYIFTLATKGMGSMQIARRLVEEKVPTPMQLHHPDRKAGNKNYNWSDKTIRRILNNRFYLGEMVYGKTARDVVGKGGKAVAREKWKVIPGHHEPIITPEVFAGVNRTFTKRSPNNMRKKYPLIGKVYCGGCGYAMSYSGSTKKCKTHNLRCAKYTVLQIPECCTYFNALLLEELVLKELYEELKRRGDFIKQREILEKSLEESVTGLKRVCRECQESCLELDRRKNSIYTQYVAGKIKAEEYRKQADQIDKQIAEVSGRQEKAEKRYEIEMEKKQKDKNDMEQIIRFSQLEELTQEAVDVFIKKVTLYQNKKVDIEWNYSESSAC